MGRSLHLVLGFQSGNVIVTAVPVNSEPAGGRDVQKAYSCPAENCRPLERKMAKRLPSIRKRMIIKSRG